MQDRGIIFSGCLYHVTTRDRAEEILKNGFDLNAQTRTCPHEFGKGVFLGGTFEEWYHFFERAKIFYNFYGFLKEPDFKEKNVVLECFVKEAFLYNHHKSEKLLFTEKMHNDIRENFDGISSQYINSSIVEYCIWVISKIEVLGMMKEKDLF